MQKVFQTRNATTIGGISERKDEANDQDLFDHRTGSVRFDAHRSKADRDKEVAAADPT